jgi:hypothetical protein
LVEASLYTPKRKYFIYFFKRMALEPKEKGHYNSKDCPSLFWRTGIMGWIIGSKHTSPV